MTDLHDAWRARQRARWLRPNARLYIRPDWQRFAKPGIEAAFLSVLEGKANFNPNQPRVPKGNPEGGQWTDEAGGRAQNDIRRIRFASSEKPQLGRQIRLTIALEMAKRIIEAYRSENGLRDLFGRNEGAVTLTAIDDQDIFGSNSRSPTYLPIDRTHADQIRDRYLAVQPEVSAGQMPSNAFYHAETTVLLRAARAQKGSLAGRTLEIFGDTKLCNNCEKILPFVGLEVGNPTVTFIEPGGRKRTMRDGNWIE